MSSKPKTRNDKAWELLFQKYNIVNAVDKNGYMNIKSEQINEFREARLMTKFDHRSNLPQLFEENGLSILPISRGEYTIARFEAYHKFEKVRHEVHSLSFPDYIQSIDFENTTSEATAINTAYVSGMLADFIGDEELLPTVDGRMSSNQFEFNIRNQRSGQIIPLSIKNSQVEIDGGYEGLSSLTLIEAKNSISDDFLIRQLYYPFRSWEKKVTKQVKPVFLTYSNGIFSLYEYVFEDITNYNSLALLKQKSYSIEPEDIHLDDILVISNETRLIEEPQGIPFPQADSFERVISLCEILHENDILSRDEITYKYDFDVRQTNYYTDAARYLGLVDKKRKNGVVNYFLSSKGKSLFNMNIKSRNLKFIKWILEHRAFYLTHKKYLKTYEMPSKETIVSFMKESQLLHVEAESTFYRRASTIAGWINWIMDLSR